MSENDNEIYFGGIVKVDLYDENDGLNAEVFDNANLSDGDSEIFDIFEFAAY